MKRKLCPFDKTECAGELCMAYTDDGRCGMVFIQSQGTSSSGTPKTEIPAKKKIDPGRKEAAERKSRYHAELFD
jgi:hypothetical protein